MERFATPATNAALDSMGWKKLGTFELATWARTTRVSEESETKTNTKNRPGEPSGCVYLCRLPDNGP